MSTSTPTLYMMVGMPCSGKTTHVQKNLSNSFLVSMDEVTVHIGKIFGYAYDDMFEKPRSSDDVSSTFGAAVKQPLEWKTWEPYVWDLLEEPNLAFMAVMDHLWNNAQKRPSIVVDATNLSIAGRKRILDKFPAHKKIAIVFNPVSLEETISRVNGRAQRDGEKYIPAATLKRMHNSFQTPTLGEGFSEIVISG